MTWSNCLVGPIVQAPQSNYRQDIASAQLGEPVDGQPVEQRHLARRKVAHFEAIPTPKQ